MIAEEKREKIAASPGQCPISLVLNIISAKWTVEILRECAQKPTRTRTLLRLIPGLSMKCLQERLKELEKHGLIVRKEYDVLPRRVEHFITPRGQKVLSIYMLMKSLAEEIFEVSCVCPMDTSKDELLNEPECPNRAIGQD